MKRTELLEAALSEEDTNKLRVLRDLFEMESSAVRSYYDEVISVGRAIETLQRSIEAKADAGISKQITTMKGIITEKVAKIKAS
jgi:hypothetical protein